MRDVTSKRYNAISQDKVEDKISILHNREEITILYSREGKITILYSREGKITVLYSRE